MALRSLDFSAARDTLRERNFALFTAGNGVSVIGTWMQKLAVGWVTWHLTTSAIWLGAVSMAELAPAVVLAPIFGVVNDRFDRRRIALVGQYFAAAQAAALAVLTIAGVITPWQLFALQLISGVIQPLIQTARLVLVPSMVPRERVGNAVAITSLTFNSARILGPMVAGALITAVGAGWSFAINAISYFGVIYALAVLDLPTQEPRPNTNLLRDMRREMAEGWQYVSRHPLLSWVLPMTGVAAVLTWPLADLLPGIADRVFARGAQGLATMLSAQGVGAILGGLLLARRPSAEGMTRILIGAMVANGCCLAIFSLTHAFWLALPMLTASSFFSVMVGIGSQALAQMAVSDDMRGRTLSAWYTITRAGPAAGVMALGTLANVFGFHGPLFCAGLLSAGTAATMWYRKRTTALPAS